MHQDVHVTEPQGIVRVLEVLRSHYIVLNKEFSVCLLTMSTVSKLGYRIQP